MVDITFAPVLVARSQLQSHILCKGEGSMVPTCVLKKKGNGFGDQLILTATLGTTVKQSA